MRHRVSARRPKALTAAALTTALVVVATSSLLAPIALAAPRAAAATSPSTAAAAGTADVLLSLRPGNLDAVRGLTQARGVPLSTRRRILAAAAPSAGATAAVRSWAAGVGLSVVPIDAWNVEVRGPAATETAEFAGGAVPGALAGVVSAALPGGRAMMRPHELPSGGETPQNYAAAYDQTLSDGSGAGVTIASVQFADWDPDDAATWAQADGIAEPSITTVPVTRELTEPTPDEPNPETALDVEALMSSAPAASQLVYEAQNGYADQLYAQLAQDAQQGRFQILTTSWGICEQQMDPDDLRAIEGDLQRIVAAGVTVMAASGDAGAYDCDIPGDGPDNAGLAVDYPGSSAYVVDVGGTRLSESSSSTYSESAWSNTSRSTGTESQGGYAGDGTGGGFSKLFAAPSWQSALGATAREVPDISSAADPRSGLEAYITQDPSEQGEWAPVGGTSLAAPLFAGQLADLLSRSACPSTCGGFGDIHAALYDAPAADFRDVTTGNNLYYSAEPGFDLTTGLGSPLVDQLGAALGARQPAPTPPAPPAPAPSPCPCGDPVLVAPALTNAVDVPISVIGGSGYVFALAPGLTTSCSLAAFTATAPTSVTLTGQGANPITVLSIDPAGVCHYAQATITLDTVAPAGTLNGRLTAPLSLQSLLSTSVSEPATQTITVTRLDVHHSTVFGPLTTTADRLTLTLPAGAYQVRTVLTDAAGNVSAPLTSSWFVPQDDRALHRSGHWSSHSHVSGAYAGTLLSTSSVGASLRGGGYGRTLSVTYRCQPTGGVLKLVIDGKQRALVDTSCAHAGFRTVTVRGLALRDHSAVVTAEPGRHGSALAVDDLAVRP